jgi:pimeloyl-ACP methyl ester carboxylesterase
MTALQGFRPLYALDTPGFGASFDPPGEPAIADYSDWLAASLDQLGVDRCHIYGHHTGTHIAAEFAASRPARVASLMLNGAAFYTATERQKRRETLRKLRTPDRDGEYLVQTWKLLVSLFPEFDPVLVNRELAGALRARPGRDQAFSAIWDQDFPATLARTSCPVIAMSASNDVFIDLLERIPAALPHIEAKVLAPAGVATPELDTDNCARLIREFTIRAETQ